MIDHLSKNSKYKKDLARYKQIIENISDEKVRKKGEALINKFLSQAALIDAGHDSRNNGYIDPRSTRDSVINLVSIRRELESFIKYL